MKDEALFQAFRALYSRLISLEAKSLAMQATLAVVAQKAGLDPVQVMAVVDSTSAEEKEKYLLGLGDQHPVASALLASGRSLEEVLRDLRSHQ